MKRFEAFFSDEKKNNTMLMNDQVATEARFDIIAEDEQRALELIDEHGFDSNEFYLEETNYHRDQLGRDYPEQLRDARL